MKFLGYEFNLGRGQDLALAEEQFERRASPENPSFSLSDPRILDALGMGDNSTGTVSPSNALTISAVFACVRVLAEGVGQLPLHLYRRTGERKREKVTDHSSVRLVTVAPNPVMSRTTYFEQQTAQMALWGAGYSQRVFDRNTDETVALYPLPSSQVSPSVVETTDDRGFPSLEKRFRVADQVYGDEEVLHVPLMTLDGYTGLSPIRMNRMGLGIALQQQRFAERFYANGAKLSGALEHPNRISKEAADRLREDWTSVYAGAGNAGKVAILEEGMKFASLVMPLGDAEFIETAKFSREQIAGIFRVPPHMIAQMDRATFSNIEHQSLEFAVYTLGPYLVKWEQALNTALLSPGEQKDHYFKFNLDALLRGDLKSRYEAYAKARQWGWLSVNDVNELEDRNEIENGDIYLQPMNMVPAGTPVEKYLKGASTGGAAEGETDGA